jgi:tRNA threonylcarbamoyl adenosine modification protein YeaZ
MTDAVLALDLSSPRGVLAVVRDGEVLHQAVFVSERSHNARLFAPLVEALQRLESTPARLVVGTGPGSYTGVRIAIAAAQAVALARGWPVFGLPTLVTASATPYRVLGDARRGQYYVAHIAEGRVRQLCLLDAVATRAEVATGGEWFTYDAVVPLGLAGVRVVQPDAVALARLAAGFSEATVTERSAIPLEPLYLQDAFITTAKKTGKQVAV